jgi:hypothetical protein
MLDYVESITVVQRLNEVLEGCWLFQILDYQIQPDEVIVQGQLTIGNASKQQFGGSSITRHRDGGDIISISDDLKAAASDCLKKCSSLFGVGLYQYSNGVTTKPKSNANGNGHVSNSDITELFSTCKASGVPQSQVIKTAKEKHDKTISQLTSNELKQLIEELT